jgi:hypothetical protein
VRIILSRRFWKTAVALLTFIYSFIHRFSDAPGFVARPDHLLSISRSLALEPGAFTFRESSKCLQICSIFDRK